MNECPNCGHTTPQQPDECYACGYTGQCALCGETTEWHDGDLRYCSDNCDRHANTQLDHA